MTTTASETLEIANIIRQQIGIGTLMAIGARDLIALDENDGQRGGLRFTVNRTRLTRIDVRLRWNDTYTVEYVKISARTHQARVVDSRDEVYCDVLADVVYTLSGSR